MTDRWRNAAICQVYVRGFADGSGDGVGDLIGVRDRLPCLAESGVNAGRLTPFHTAPMPDFADGMAGHGDADPLFGSLADGAAPEPNRRAPHPRRDPTGLGAGRSAPDVPGAADSAAWWKVK